MPCLALGGRPALEAVYSVSATPGGRRPLCKLSLQGSKQGCVSSGADGAVGRRCTATDDTRYSTKKYSEEWLGQPPPHQGSRGRPSRRFLTLQRSALRATCPRCVPLELSDGRRLQGADSRPANDAAGTCHVDLPPDRGRATLRHRGADLLCNNDPAPTSSASARIAHRAASARIRHKSPSDRLFDGA